MFSSIFSQGTNSPTFHPISSALKPDEMFGELDPNDMEWVCAGGFVTETQTFYTITEDGTSFMFQVIYSSVGVWFPTVQFTCKVYNADADKDLAVWRSVSVSNFKAPPNPDEDKRSSKGDQYSITYHPANGDKPEYFTIQANLTKDFQVLVDVSRPNNIPGFKIGKGPTGGFSYYGSNKEKPDGYVVHHFWPRTFTEGHVTHKGRALPVKGPGMFVHAIQGMRPNLIACRWNFANFQSDEHGGVSAIQMEFTTLDTHGRYGAGSGGVSVNIGGVVIGGRLVAVTAETKWPDEEQSPDALVVSRAAHLKTAHDPDTGYHAPGELVFQWAAPALEGSGQVSAKLHVDVGNSSSPKGLIEKVDLLAEIPYVVKMAAAYIAGTKPYIYQWFNPTKLIVKGPDSIIPGLSKGIEVNGRLYNEATFIS